MKKHMICSRLFLLNSGDYLEPKTLGGFSIPTSASQTFVCIRILRRLLPTLNLFDSSQESCLKIYIPNKNPGNANVARKH
jgi:hypothetical protein